MWNFSFWWWLKILIIFQNGTLNMYTFKNSYLFKITFINVMHWEKKIYINYQNIHSKIHLHVKVIFGKKDLQCFSKVIILAPSYKFWPILSWIVFFYSVFFLNVDFFNNVYSYERLLIKAWIKVICFIS